MKFARSNKENLLETYKDTLNDEILKMFPLKSGIFQSQWNKARKRKELATLERKEAKLTLFANVMIINKKIQQSEEKLFLQEVSKVTVHQVNKIIAFPKYQQILIEKYNWKKFPQPGAIKSAK